MRYNGDRGGGRRRTRARGGAVVVTPSHSSRAQYVWEISEPHGVGTQWRFGVGEGGTEEGIGHGYCVLYELGQLGVLCTVAIGRRPISYVPSRSRR